MFGYPPAPGGGGGGRGKGEGSDGDWNRSTLQQVRWGKAIRAIIGTWSKSQSMVGRDVPRLLWSEGGEYAMLAIDWWFASRPWLVEFQGLSY